MRRALLLTALIAAGCGGSAKPAKTPAGFKTFAGDGYSFDYPASWGAIAGGDTRGAQGARGTGGLAPQAAVGRDAKPQASLDLTIQGFKADQTVRRARWKVVSDKPVDVDGAAGAHRIEGNYLEVTGASTTPVRTIGLLVRTKDGVQLDFFVRAPQADFDRARLPAVFDSFRLK